MEEDWMSKPDALVYDNHPETLIDRPLHYCPGCHHGVAHKEIMHVVEELGIQSEVIGVAPVGCSVFAYHYMNVDMQEAAHGRACAVATGIKRVRPDKTVFTYQGDGDLAAIGTAETLHAVNRGENILIIFINNAIYGMTGGQMAPTTLEGMQTSTTPYGRNIKDIGYPLKMTDLVAHLPGAYYVTRQSVHTPNAVRKFKKALKKAFEYLKDERGTCFVEIVSNCPSGWKMTPVESVSYIEEKMLPEFPVGDLKTPEK
ncbi:MAG: 2-oxoglutarate oxidoreductase [Ignavibacteriales bacterium]|nr:2-oxoglutarate oxidoreductase [Ignavibacteriales bacterium]